MGAGLYLSPSQERMEQSLESFLLNASKDIDQLRPCGPQIITAANKGKTENLSKHLRKEVDRIKNLETVLHLLKSCLSSG